MTASPIRVLVWNENIHESTGDEKAIAHYPHGIHTAIAEGLRQHLGGDAEVLTATLQEPEHGLTQEVVDRTDVLLWWGHAGHEQVDDEIVSRVHEAILGGMGILVLHSGHYSKIFKRLMGTSCELKWREADDTERLWVVEPGHPIAAGLDETVSLGPEEMYGERFDIPAPETLVFVSWFKGGEVFRSGCCYTRGRGKIFYFRPGHESYPTYFNPEIRRVIANAARWAAPVAGPKPVFGNFKPLEK